MRSMTLLTLSALALSGAAPAFAQDAMSSHDQMASGQMKAGKKMSAADTKKMKACNAMSHEAMMKDAKCVKITKAHPDMMSHDSMMKHAN